MLCFWSPIQVLFSLPHTIMGEILQKLDALRCITLKIMGWRTSSVPRTVWNEHRVLLWEQASGRAQRGSVKRPCLFVLEERPVWCISQARVLGKISFLLKSAPGTSLWLLCSGRYSNHLFSQDGFLLLLPLYLHDSVLNVCMCIVLAQESCWKFL